MAGAPVCQARLPRVFLALSSRLPLISAALCLNQAMFARKIRVEYEEDGRNFPAR